MTKMKTGGVYWAYPSKESGIERAWTVVQMGGKTSTKEVWFHVMGREETLTLSQIDEVRGPIRVLPPDKLPLTKAPHP